jgi:hypothetical protein
MELRTTLEERELDPAATEVWDALNARPARDLPGLRRLMERPSPFTPASHAQGARAKKFYLHLVPEFEASPTDELHLVLLIKDIRRTLVT